MMLKNVKIKYKYQINYKNQITADNFFFVTKIKNYSLCKF